MKRVVNLNEWLENRNEIEANETSNSVDEAYDGKMADFKYDLEMAVEEIGFNSKAIKKVSKVGKRFEVRMSSYMSQRSTWERIGELMGATLVEFKPDPKSINVGLYESVEAINESDWGTYDTPEGKMVAKELNKAWTTFAKTVDAAHKEWLKVVNDYRGDKGKGSGFRDSEGRDAVISAMEWFIEKVFMADRRFGGIDYKKYRTLLGESVEEAKMPEPRKDEYYFLVRNNDAKDVWKMADDEFGNHIDRGRIEVLFQKNKYVIKDFELAKRFYQYLRDRGVKFFDQNFVSESVEPLCEATVEMDAMDPDNKEFLKFLKKNRVKIISKEMQGPGGGTPVITMQGSRKDLENVLADDEYGWDDADLAEYIEESVEVHEAYDVELFWKGLSGEDKKIGRFLVSKKDYEALENDFGGEVEFDLYDDKASGKMVKFNDVVAAMKNTKYGKTAMKESINEARSLNKIQKDFSAVTSEMAEVVQNWKAAKESGDAKAEANLLARLKELTAKKKGLEKEMDEFVMGKDRDAELAGVLEALLTEAKFKTGQVWLWKHVDGDKKVEVINVKPNGDVVGRVKGTSQDFIVRDANKYLKKKISESIVNEAKVDLAQLTDILANLEDAFTEEEFIEVGQDVNVDAKTMQDIWNGYWEVDAKNRLHWGDKEWAKWLKANYGVK